jgi:HTH-type transcriptional regulator / antitoxin HigA
MSKPIKSQVKPDYAIPPGETLKEWLEESGMSQVALALRMGRPKKTINEIIAGASAITPETSLQLENVTGISASFWNNAESSYRETLARIQEHEALTRELEWAKAFPYKELAKRSFVPDISIQEQKVKNLLRFFSVAGPKQWASNYVEELRGAAHGSTAFKSDIYDLSAWLRIGELEASKIDCQPYDEKKFKTSLAVIRKLTAQDVSEQSTRLPELCRESGVAFVLVPELPKTHVNGFTRWLSSSKALIQQSLRHKRDDHLWFTFFHEAAHILLHGRKETFLEYNGLDDAKEQEANEWARNYLIPLRDWNSFISRYAGIFSETTIRSFASDLEISPSIVLGRLQKERYVPFSRFNSIFTQLEFAED